MWVPLGGGQNLYHHLLYLLYYNGFLKDIFGEQTRVLPKPCPHVPFENEVLFLVFASFTSAYLVMGSRLPLRALIEKALPNQGEKIVGQMFTLPETNSKSPWKWDGWKILTARPGKWDGWKMIHLLPGQKGLFAGAHILKLGLYIKNQEDFQKIN